MFLSEVSCLAGKIANQLLPGNQQALGLNGFRGCARLTIGLYVMYSTLRLWYLLHSLTIFPENCGETKVLIPARKAISAL